MMELEGFLKKQKSLLEDERKAEIEEANALVKKKDFKKLEIQGVALTRLEVSRQFTGLYGRNVLELKRFNEDKLPSHNFKTGDIVELSPFQDEATEFTATSGVITVVTAEHLCVAFEDDFVAEAKQLKIVKLANDVTYKRLKDALNILENPPSVVLRDIVFSGRTLSPAHQTLPPKLLDEDGNLELFNIGLDASQREAVDFALRQRELAVIHGPPGTGKTTTVVEVITQAVKAGSKVLCCAPSNIAVDNLLERLARNKVRVVRLGHPARVSEELQKFSLDSWINNNDQTELVQAVRKDMEAILAKMKKKRGGERFGLRTELKSLKKELQTREKQAIKESLLNAQVVLSTLTSASADGPLKHLPADHFDVTVIDECSQSLEMACWIVLPRAPKTILSGDHFQLPPTIMSKSAAKDGLAVTLMERVIDRWNQDVVRMLTTQYRMNEKIMQWSSDKFYHGKLIAHDSVKSHLLKDMVSDTEITAIPLLLIDTEGCDMYELETSDEVSKANEGEVQLVCIHVEELIKSGVKPADIAVITPYNLQVELIRLQLAGRYQGLEVRSVDGFQGREKEAVVLSLVRSNPDGEVGFLSDSRRLNVAVTRARRHVAVICDSGTMAHDEFLKGFVEYMEANGEIRSAHQYEHQMRELVLPEGLEFTRKQERSKGEKKGEKIEVKGEKKKERAKKTPKKKEEKRWKEMKEVNTEVAKEQEEEKTKAKEEEFQEILDSFVRSEEVSYEFPSDLTSHSRMLVHDLAERMNLKHTSKGEGKKRFIFVEKPGHTATQDKENVKSFKSERESPAEDEEKPAVIPKTVQCSTCLKDIPKTNIELHKLRCAKPVVDRPAKDSKQKANKKKSKKKEDEEDIEKLLENFTKVDKVCNYSGCKTLVTVLGAQCDFCRLRFCLTHAMAEVHGCGSEARHHARNQFLRQKGTVEVQKKPMDPAKRAQLRRNLDKKLNSMEDQRKTKKKPEK